MIMISDDALADLWKEATRQSGQPQVVHPQKNTLRVFASMVWDQGRNIAAMNNPYL